MDENENIEYRVEYLPPQQISVHLPEAKSEIERSNFQYKWRFESRIVAWLDIVLSAVFLVILIPASVSLTGAAIFTEWLKWNEIYRERIPQLTAESWNFKMRFIIALFYIYSIVSCISIWAGNKLRVSTNLSFSDIHGAFRRANVWMRFNLTTAFISSKMMFVRYPLWPILFCFLNDIVRIIVVYKFIQELKENRDLVKAKEKNFPEKEDTILKITQV